MATKGTSKEITEFEYEQLDDSTADFLRTKETNMRHIVGKYTKFLEREFLDKVGEQHA